VLASTSASEIVPLVQPVEHDVLRGTVRAASPLSHAPCSLICWGPAARTRAVRRPRLRCAPRGRHAL